MKSNIRLGLLLVLLLSAISLCGCEANKAEASTARKQQTEYELTKYDSNYDKILSGCTKEFLGNHPIDESFFMWFTHYYGESALETITDKGRYDNAKVWVDATGKSIHVLWYEYCKTNGIESYDNQFTHVINTRSDDEIVFDIAGDLSMAEDKATTNYMLEQKNRLMDCFNDNLLEAINESDVFVVNNEFSYTLRGDAITAKYYTFRGDPEYIRELKKIGVDSVTLANNHVYDYSEEGFLDTLKHLEDYKMPYVGAGRNLEDAKRPLYYIANGMKIALVNGSQIEKNQNFTKAASEDEGGILKCLDPTEFIDEIEKAKKNSDYVIAVVHWGTEYQTRYGSDQAELAQQFADAGADVIVGGHPHVLQGFDYIGNVPVYYSLGNFYFSLDEKMPIDYDTALAKVTINKNGDIKAGFIPCHFSEGIISLVDNNDDAQIIYDELNSVSDNAMLDKNGLIIKK